MCIDRREFFILDDSNPCPDVGTTSGLVSAADSALHPGRIEGGWEENKGADGKGEWQLASELVILSGKVVAPLAPSDCSARARWKAAAALAARARRAAATTTAAAAAAIPVLFITAAAAAKLRGAGTGARVRWPTIEVKQKLITVQPTYLLTQSEGVDGGCTGKMVSRPTALSYGGRADFGRGMAEITRAPVLTMEQEFQRDDRWTDWKGMRYSAAAEWAYVTFMAFEGGPDGAHETRDKGNAGKTAEDFLAAANTHILQELQQKGTQSSGKIPRTQKQQPGRQMQKGLDRDTLMLVLEEVLAIRLYSGPAYAPINTFLREVAKLSTDWRSKLARDPKTTYSATVGWLVSGVRKLAHATQLSKLYRGVKGQLPEAFAVPDVQGMVSATDFGFMSTSRSKAVCVSYMSKTQPNVLWELECRNEDEAYHNGADIAIISQYPGEEEVLFPPLTMMVASGPQQKLRMVDEEDAGGTQYKVIGVVPYYV